jgi:glycosyltransferase involved in cell wall biosynthesis
VTKPKLKLFNLNLIKIVNLSVNTPKISIVASDLSSRGAGRWGGANRPFLLAHALKKIGYTVEIVGLAFDSDSPTLYDPEIPVSSIPCSYYSGVINASKELLNKINGDIIYAVKLKPTSFGLAILKKLITNKPLILDIDDWELSWYGGENFQYKPSLKQLIKDIFPKEAPLRYPDHPLYLSWLEKLTSYADIVTTHTQFLQQRFGGSYIPNGKDINLFNPNNHDPEVSRSKYGLTDYKILMFPGAPRSYKGLEDVLTALDILNKPELKLVIVGGSPYDNYDQKLREKWDKWIIQLPKTPVNLMPEIVAAAHIIVVPQKNTDAAKAQFPLKLTDGMAMAKPILATKVGDIPDILADTGFLVEPDSPQEIAGAINYIFDNWELAQNKGLAARQRCLSYYSIDTMALILNNLIDTLLSK